ncbi:peptidase [Oscillatoriales cyanobacterium USR001]|nr:peptidase [Oscillatoriales cyanobacterium USR001]
MFSYLKHKLLTLLSLSFCAFILIIITQIQSDATNLNTIPDKLPELQVHPLPVTLANWQDSGNNGDYFDQLKPPGFGHLIWSQFPIKVYVESFIDRNGSEEWRKIVLNAVLEWGVYLPLQVVDKLEDADIKILHESPPLRSGELRARSGETRYELYVSKNGDRDILSHRCTIWLNPTQTGKYIAAVARHEFGHSLGIWGHSLIDSDVMYFSQVRTPPPISSRDINTLKRVYEQQTRLGWSFF